MILKNKRILSKYSYWTNCHIPHPEHKLIYSTVSALEQKDNSECIYELIQPLNFKMKHLILTLKSHEK